MTASNIVLETLYKFCEEHNFKHPHMIIAKELVAKGLEQSQCTIENIKLIVYSYFNFTIEQVERKTRKREIVQARQIAHFFAKETSDHFELGWSFADIGKEIGKKNHATVLHACKRVEGFCETERSYNMKIIAIRDIIRINLKPPKINKNNEPRETNVPS